MRIADSGRGSCERSTTSDLVTFLLALPPLSVPPAPTGALDIEVVTTPVIEH